MGNKVGLKDFGAEKLKPKMAISSDVNRLSRFQGCLVGAVVGDCMGEPFEFNRRRQGDPYVTDFLNEKLSYSPGKGKKVQLLPYTDDTALTRAIAQSLIQNRCLKAEDLARRYTDEYYKDPYTKGWGIHVVTVFKTLKKSDYKDVYGPAQKQFGGEGSYGNGAAMRVSPIGLLYYTDKDNMIKQAKESSVVTHSNPEGYKGAILQCLALRLILLQSEPIEPAKFLDQLILEMNILDTEKTEPKERPYSDKLDEVKEALKKKDFSPEAAATLLGTGEPAYESVATAIYAFLRGLEPIPQFQSDSSFVRTLYVAICMGGDTDTIASMACALSGAHVGIQGIPPALPLQCEGAKDAQEQGEALESILLSTLA